MNKKDKIDPLIEYLNHRRDYNNYIKEEYVMLTICGVLAIAIIIVYCLNLTY
jgi:hypothetical protein